jgi:sialate O-acetylesterase
MKFNFGLYVAPLLLTVAILQAGAQGEARVERPFLSQMFTSNMVLQRNMKDAVWGWTEPGKEVTVSIEGKTAKATADAQGKWLARIGPLPAGGPYKLTVSGPQTVELDNVLVGDVWICSGQSNMEMGIGNVNNAQQEIADADYPQVRLYTVEKTIATEPRTGLGRDDKALYGQWSVCTPQTVATGGWNGFSAVGYFFGRELYKELHVPIGLIHTSWGGTIAEAWTSGPALRPLKDFDKTLDQLEKTNAEHAQGELDHGKAMVAWYEHNDPGTRDKWGGVATDSTGWETMNLPTAWEQAGIPTLEKFDGIVWFRKEFDLPAGAEQKDIKLHLGPIDDDDTTWVNGVQVGGIEGYNIDRTYTVHANLLKPGKNVIAVRVLDTGGAGGIYGKPEQLTVEIPGQAPVALAGPWQYKIGIELGKATALPMAVDNNPNIPTVLFNGMIAPLVPYGIKGAIWYQGESNAGRAYQYRKLLPAMIGDWRNHWGEGDFPFYIVQLANWQPLQTQPGDSDWAELREAQSMTAKNVPHSGEAVIIDIGDAGDIHPKDKQDVGKRLALVALDKDYGKKVEYSGPVYKSMQVEGDKIVLSFDHLGGGLTVKGEKPEGFAIAGEDRKWVWGDAKIVGNAIVVSSPQVPKPVAVRYAWHINPICNLYNKAGLPASPFRTDDWPGVTINNK